ncbi:MAG: diguanylate cyclase [Hydrogenophaga sp.]|uniref:diguanylate cyclase domain-containing protein n=1 Tax=Hydrogenophaga sp. TaxID=1904254 RepID=UPI0027502630|nr:diguanylate cyclase [Hydrogenophaga sp.]MDP2419086.1 diguanylate cyclase [Hydrogenophaga sp.]MDZ4188665.1 diguanylate cyclase [Hydrogenophaga sp.]
MTEEFNIKHNDTYPHHLMSSGSGFPRQPRLLVVEDQPLHIQVLNRALSPECRVFMVTQGKQAVQFCVDRQPDLVLLDVEMPDMDGFHVLEALKADEATRNIPVIFVTAHTSTDMETRCLQAGAVDFISKPINPSVVKARVHTHLKLKFQSDLMHQWVYLDGMTGAFNRRYFDDQLQTEWRRAQRTAKPLSVILMDVDFFKAYNDHYGHLRGDQALRTLVKAAKPVLQRPGDFLARYGGEEFVCLLPDTALADAATLAERIRKAVIEQKVLHEHNLGLGVMTISLGVAESFQSGIIDAEQLIGAADKNLYVAKHSGKNRVCFTDQ